MRRYGKYNARKTVYDGIKFDSQKEAHRYQELKLMEVSGYIEGLELQPRFTLQPKKKVNGKTIRKIEYVADFKYYSNTEKKWIVEDEGVKTQVYKIKEKCFYITMGMTISL